jgi:hypothetical protein
MFALRLKLMLRTIVLTCVFPVVLQTADQAYRYLDNTVEDGSKLSDDMVLALLAAKVGHLAIISRFPVTPQSPRESDVC